jgi:ATP-dependent protease ClpP protease subunit
MEKKMRITFLFILLQIFNLCIADTFTNINTGEQFVGYSTNINRGNKTLIRVGHRHKGKYLNLSEFDIEYNSKGRRKVIPVLHLEGAITLKCVTESFESELSKYSNRGPLMIIIVIDTPGGSTELMKRICSAIQDVNNSLTLAFIKNGKYGGAYSAGAIIALACDKIAMKNGAAIGAATTVVQMGNRVTSLKNAYGESYAEKILSASRNYAASIASSQGKSPVLAKAMVDPKITVLEIKNDSEAKFITKNKMTEKMKVKGVWSKEESLLTLSTQDAIYCGIADIKADSLIEIAQKFFPEQKGRFIRKKVLQRTKKNFKRAEKKSEKLIAKIKQQQRDINIILQEIQKLEEIIDRTHSITYRNEHSRYSTRQGTIYKDEYEEYIRKNPKAFKKLKQKVDNCYYHIESFEDDCKDLKTLINQHIDLEQYNSFVNEALLGVQSTYHKLDAVDYIYEEY